MEVFYESTVYSIFKIYAFLPLIVLQQNVLYLVTGYIEEGYA